MSDDRGSVQAMPQPVAYWPPEDSAVMPVEITHEQRLALAPCRPGWHAPDRTAVECSVCGRPLGAADVPLLVAIPPGAVDGLLRVISEGAKAIGSAGMTENTVDDLSIGASVMASLLREQKLPVLVDGLDPGRIGSMTNDLLTRLEAATYEGEPFVGDRVEWVAGFIAGQQLRRSIARHDEPAVLNERYRADTTAVPAGFDVYPEVWTYARRRSLAFQVATPMLMTRPKMIAASLTPTGLPVVRYPTEGIGAATSDATFEAAPVQLIAKTAVAWANVSGELIEDWSGPMEGDAVAGLGRVFMDALLDEIDRVYLEGDTTGGDAFNGLVKAAGVTAAAGTSPAAAIAALNPAAIPTLVYIVIPATLTGWQSGAYTVGSGSVVNALDSLSQLATNPTIAATILGRPVVIMPADWLTGSVGVVGALKRATVVGLRSAPNFEVSTDVPEAWTAGAYAVRAMARYAIGIVQPTMICKLT